jgi:hypothetical protein
MTFEGIFDQAIAMLQWAAGGVGIAIAGAVGAGASQRQGPSRPDRRGMVHLLGRDDIGVGGIVIDEHYQH